MSVYARIQFCMPEGASPAIELRQHPDLPVLMLTLSHADGEVTFDGTPESLRAWLAALLSHPLLANAPIAAPDSGSVYYEGAEGFTHGARPMPMPVPPPVEAEGF